MQFFAGYLDEGAGVVSVDLSQKEDAVQRAVAVFEEHGEFIRKVIDFQSSNVAQGEDLFQEFFLSLVAKPIPEHLENTKSYLYRSVVNDVIDAARRVKRHQGRLAEYAEHRSSTSSSPNPPEDPLVRAEEMDKMFNSFERLLPPSESRAIALRYKNNYSTTEVAQTMGVNTKSVSRYISVGIRKLRDAFGVKGGVPNDRF